MSWRILITLVLAVCVGCSSDSDDSSQSGKVPPSPDSSQAVELPPPPEVGQCRNTPDGNLDDGDGFDETPVVDCLQTHTLETIVVIETDGEITPEILEQLAMSCHTAAAAEYFDFPGPGPYKWNWPLVFGPTPEQQDAGQSWVRCDAGFYGDTFGEDPLMPRTGSLEGAMGKDIARFQQCIAEAPDLERSQALVPCKEPHRAELLLTIARIDESAYSPAHKRKTKGQSLCQEVVADRDDADSLLLTPVWQDKEYWHDGKVELGCWIHRQTGLLPPA